MEINKYKLPEGSSIILDFIRGISAQLVVYGHGALYCGVLIIPFFDIQNIAVGWFFIISGFVITYSTVNKIKKNSDFSFKHYFIDRFSRIYTAYIPAIVFVLILDYISKSISKEAYNFDSAFNLKTFIGNLFMLQDFPYINFCTSFGSARPFWTLAVEWWIYIFFGYLILYFFRSKTNRIVKFLWLGLLIIVPAFNLVGGRGNGLMLTWLLGGIVYLVVTLKLIPKINLINKVMWIFLFLILFIWRLYIVRMEYDAILAFLLALIMYFLIEFFSEFNFNETIKYLIRYNSSFSYTLYLIHYTIFDFLITHFKEYLNGYILFFIGFFLSNVISIILGRFTEIDLTKKVKYYLYRKCNIVINS